MEAFRALRETDKTRETDGPGMARRHEAEDEDPSRLAQELNARVAWYRAWLERGANAVEAKAA